MNNFTEKKQLLTIIVLVIAAAFSRLIPHPFNLTAIGALALFSGAKVTDKRLAYVIPFAALLISDLIIGFHATMLPVYLCFAFTVWLGTNLHDNSGTLKTALFSVTGSVVFFMITNLPIWYGGFYPMTLAGTITSYTAAIPFFSNQLLGDLLYTGVLFSAFQFVNKKYLVKAA